MGFNTKNRLGDKNNGKDTRLARSGNYQWRGLTRSKKDTDVGWPEKSDGRYQRGHTKESQPVTCKYIRSTKLYSNSTSKRLCKTWGIKSLVM